MDKQQNLTTYVQVDINTFRDVVQRLTGPSTNSSINNIEKLNNNHQQKRHDANSIKGQASSTKLHERRQNEFYARPKLEIVKPPLNFQFQSMVDRRRQRLSWGSPSSFMLSPSSSPVDTPSATFSKLSILEQDDNKTEQQEQQDDEDKEEKALKEKRFYLHPSPRSKSNHGFTEPELLSLFPVISSRPSDKPSA